MLLSTMIPSKKPNSIAVLDPRRLGLGNSPFFKGLYPQNYCTKSEKALELFDELFNLFSNP
jgi:hypothetical protein